MGCYLNYQAPNFHFDVLKSSSICSKTCFTHNAWLSHSQSSMDTCRAAHTCHALSIRQSITNDVMQHKVTSNIHTSHTEIRLIFHSLLLRSDVTDIHSMRWYLLDSLSINTRLESATEVLVYTPAVLDLDISLAWVSVQRITLSRVSWALTSP